jgi:hypothetical protein
MIGLGRVIVLSWKKPRTPLGKWLDDRNLSQEWLITAAEINKNTATTLCSDGKHVPTEETRRKVMRAIKTVDDSASAQEFWP